MPNLDSFKNSLSRRSIMNLDKLIKAKEALGFSSVDISARSGVPASTVYKIFQGQTENPRRETIEAIERALGLRPEETEYSDVLREDTVYGGYIYGSSAQKQEHSVKKQGEYTTEDLDDLPEETRLELIDGIIYDMAAPTITHQIIVTNLTAAFFNYVSRKKGKCIVVSSPGTRLDCDNKTEVQPDVSITCDRAKIKNGRIFGAPDLIVEIVSPSNRTHDTVRKLKKYRSAGVREYWLVFPDEKLILVHLFGDDHSVKAYTFRDTVPVSIYDGDCMIDFAALDDYLTDIFGDYEAEIE